MANNNRTCIVCGQSYKYCPNCAEFSNLEIWHNIFHDANCKEIYNAASMYGKVPTEETKKRLDKCDLSNKSNFHKNIVKVIDELYAVKEEPTITIAKESTTVNEENTNETMETTIEEKEIIKEEPMKVNMTYNRKIKR